jgi:hypothetical protein
VARPPVAGDPLEWSREVHLLMQCQLCAALNREHSDECEAEASATLKRRSQLLASHPGDASMQDQLDQDVLSSRKRQAHIASELHEHRIQEHRDARLVQAAGR